MTRFLTSLILLSAVALMVLSTPACGYRGPLYLPDEDGVPATAEDPADPEDPEDEDTDL